MPIKRDPLAVMKAYYGDILPSLLPEDREYWATIKDKLKECFPIKDLSKEKSRVVILSKSFSFSPVFLALLLWHNFPRALYFNVYYLLEVAYGEVEDYPNLFAFPDNLVYMMTMGFYEDRNKRQQDVMIQFLEQKVQTCSFWLYLRETKDSFDDQGQRKQNSRYDQLRSYFKERNFVYVDLNVLGKPGSAEKPFNKQDTSFKKALSSSERTSILQKLFGGEKNDSWQSH